MSIWARFLQTGKIEKIDECAKSEAGYLVQEYSLVYRGTAVVWAGKKSDLAKQSVFEVRGGR